MSKPYETSGMTLKEWVDILADLDAYIANGGLLHALPLPELPPQAFELLAQRINPEGMDRIRRFFARLIRVVPVEGTAGMTEDQFCAAWRETANASSERLH
jgi:hypothetical protein